jgi:hypothetical protein
METKAKIAKTRDAFETTPDSCRDEAISSIPIRTRESHP